MTDVTPFDFKGATVRTVLIDDVPWFVVNDVCAILEIANPHDAARRVAGKYLGETEVLDGRGLSRMTNIVAEPGLYALIFRSNKPEAETFREWVFEEVLPSIRKTGSYGTPALKNPVLNQVVQVALQLQATQDEQERLAAVQDQQGEQLSSLAAEVATVRALVPHMPNGSGHSIKELAHATGIPFLKMHEILRQRGITYRDQQKGGIKPYAEWITKGWAREELEQVRGVGATWVTYFTDSGLTEVKRRLSA